MNPDCKTEKPLGSYVVNVSINKLDVDPGIKNKFEQLRSSQSGSNRLKSSAHSVGEIGKSTINTQRSDPNTSVESPKLLDEHVSAKFERLRKSKNTAEKEHKWKTVEVIQTPSSNILASVSNETVSVGIPQQGEQVQQGESPFMMLVPTEKETQNLFNSEIVNEKSHIEEEDIVHEEPSFKQSDMVEDISALSQHGSNNTHDLHFGQTPVLHSKNSISDYTDLHHFQLDHIENPMMKSTELYRHHWETSELMPHIQEDVKEAENNAIVEPVPDIVLESQIYDSNLKLNAEPQPIVQINEVPSANGTKVIPLKQDLSESIRHAYNLLRKAKANVDDSNLSAAAEIIATIWEELSGYSNEAGFVFDESSLDLMRLIIANVAKIFFKLNMRYHALENAEKIVRFDPENFEAMGMVTKIFARLGQNRFDLKEYKKSLRLQASDVQICFQELLLDLDFLTRVLHSPLSGSYITYTEQDSEYRPTPMGDGIFTDESVVEPRQIVEQEETKELKKSESKSKLGEYAMYSIPCLVGGMAISKFVYKTDPQTVKFWSMAGMFGLGMNSMLSSNQTVAKVGFGVCLAAASLLISKN